MSTKRTALLLCGALAFASPLHAAPQHDHAAHAAFDGKEIPAPSPRWAADEPLRDGMGRIHQALAELRHHEMGHMSDAMAQDRAGLILDAGAYIFAHCKLQPQQDAVLHGMLVPLLSAAQKLKDQPQDVAEVAVMREAVAGYPRYFDDPAWADDAMPGHAHHQ